MGNLNDACPDDDQLVAFLEGRLDEHELEALHKHIDRCPNCTRHMALLGTLMEDESTAKEGLGRVGPYTLLRLLGEGGMGRVYEAKEPRESRHVAIKLLKGMHRSATARQRLQREAKLLMRLRHPNVLPVFEVGEHEGQLYMVMHRVAGGSVRWWLGSQPRRWPEIVSVFQRAGRGLAAAHQRGVVHRDIKPGNILVGDQGGVWLADFGLARLVDMEALLADGASPISLYTLTQVGAVLGTPAYMSPEQHLGGVADERSDQFSLCVALFESLYDELPFSGKTRQELALHVCAGRLKPPPTPTVPESLYTVLARGLVQHPEQRYPSIEALLEALERASQLNTVISVGLGRAEEQQRALAPMSDRFVGRGAEMEALRVMLAKGRRLISVVGAAGTGKTRLVRELGVGLGARGLVRLCDLAEVRDTEALSDAVLRAMGVPPVGQNLARQVEQALAVQRELMLILDNAERIGDGLQEPLKRWLEEAPELRVVVTSRQPVGMEQEQLLELEPLGLPAPDAGLVEVEQSEAVQLFVERLRQLQGRFILNDSNRAVVCTLVRMLDGLPLALELAAARVPMLSLEGLKAQLHRRFEVLRGSPRFTPLRHISLRVALDGSWEQLDPSEQMALAQASVFEGGFSLEDVEAVLEVATPPTQAQLLDVLDVLLLRSLVKVDIDAREGPRRFRMLVSVQAYARERLTEMDETVATERRHLEWFAQQGSQEALEAVHGHEEHTLFLMLAQNLDNLRAALARSVAMGAWPEAAQVSMALGTLYERQGPYHIGARNLAQVATHAEVPEQARAQLHYVRAKLLRLGGKIKEARATREKALELARRIGARRLEAACLGYSVDKGDGDPNARCEQALELARELGERRIEGDCLGEYGVLLQRQGRLDEALDRLRQAVNIAVEVGDAYAEAQWTVAIGKVFHSKGELVGSRHHIEQALRLHRKVGNRRGEVNARVYLAVLDKREGRMEEAQRRYEETLVMMRELENVEGECMIYGNLGNIYKSQGWLDQAQRCYQRAVELAIRMGDIRSEIMWRINYADSNVLLGRYAAAHQDFSTALKQIRVHNVAIFEHFALAGLGEVCLSEGNPAEAECWMVKALDRAHAQGDRHSVASWHSLMGQVLQAQGRLEEAEEHFEQGEAIFHTLGMPFELARTLSLHAGLSAQQQKAEKMEALLAQARVLSHQLELTTTSEIHELICSAEGMLKALEAGDKV